MKSSLVVKLIEAHSSGIEDAFENALNILADDEEKKGNLNTSSSLRKAYTCDKKRPVAYRDSPLSEMSFSLKNAIPLPKDKDTTLELEEVYKAVRKDVDYIVKDEYKRIIEDLTERLLEKTLTTVLKMNINA